MNTISSIYYKLLGNYYDNPEFIIDFWDKNSILLNNISIFNNPDELSQYLEIFYQYLNALYKKGQFNNSLTKISKILPVIDKNIIRLNSHILKDEWYYGIIHFKGMASYKVRDFKSSKQAFSSLVKVDSKNENYKNWLQYATYENNKRYITGIEILCGLLFLVVLIFKSYIPSYYVRMTILLSGLFGSLTCLVYEHYTKRSFRKAL